MLTTITDGRPIRPVDPEVRAALHTLERAIGMVADVRADDHKAGGAKDREYTKAGAMFDRLARVAEYVERAAF